MPLPRKKNIKEIDVSLLTEPRLSDDEKRLFQHGIELFNGQHYWHAHEVWEELWKRREEESRIFFQGMIQAAAAFHRIVADPKYNGALNNIDKALTKLELFPATFLGIDVDKLRKNLVESRRELQQLGSERMREFTLKLLSKI